MGFFGKSLGNTLGNCNQFSPKNSPIIPARVLRPQTVWGSGRIMYHNVDDEDDMMRMMMMRIMLRTMMLRIMMLRMRMMRLRRTTDPKTGDDTFASVCSRNAGGHFTRATSCENLQVKCRRPRPGTTLCASLRNRNARGHFTIWWFQVIPLPYTHAHTQVYIYAICIVCLFFVFIYAFFKKKIIICLF